MKLIITFLFCFLAIFAKAQYMQQSMGGSPNIMNTVEGAFKAKKGLVLTSYPDTTLLDLNIKKTHGFIILIGDTIFVRNAIVGKWIKIGAANGSSSDVIAGGSITTIPSVGFNPGTNLTTLEWIQNTFYGTQDPIATLSGGGIFEYTSASTQSATLNWSASRQSNTATIGSIVVASVNKPFSQPLQPGTVSGTQLVSVPTNTTTTYTNVVTTTDLKSATASVTFTYRQKMYIGYINNNLPSDGNLIATSGVFATSRIASGTLAAPSSSSYIVFAYPASFGSATIKINGLAVVYVLTTRSFVNASGYSELYNIYVSPFPTNAGVDYQVL